MEMRSTVVTTKQPTMKLTYRPRGTRDFTPAETEKHRHVENRMQTTAEQWGYEETKTATFEHTELFTIKSGETILGEFYAFKDKCGREIAPFHNHRQWLSEISVRSARIISRVGYHVE